jgi:anti-sigma factor RsiW
VNGKVLQFGTTMHPAVEAALPWYINGTLDADERRQVEEHLRECARCRRDVEWLQTFQAGYSDSEGSLPCEQSWDRLRERIAPLPPSWRRLARGFTFDRAPRLVPGRAAWAVAVPFIFILAIGGTLLSAPQRPPETYRTLAAASKAAALSARLAVKFNPERTQAETTAILRQVGATIVDGPIATDAYVLSVPAERVDDVLKTLHEERAVSFVERLDMKGRN